MKLKNIIVNNHSNKHILIRKDKDFSLLVTNISEVVNKNKILNKGPEAILMLIKLDQTIIIIKMEYMLKIIELHLKKIDSSKKIYKVYS
jgi:hypothetical protein